MHIYIVRVYRPDERTSDGQMGLVERVGVSRQVPFQSFDELRKILSPTNGKAIRKLDGSEPSSPDEGKSNGSSKRRRSKRPRRSGSGRA